MSRLEAGFESSQMPYPAAIGFQFLFQKLRYRLSNSRSIAALSSGNAPVIGTVLEIW